MLQDCKYRLPCNWCDKYDRMCEAVLFEIYNQKNEEKCEHDWELKDTKATDYTDGCNRYYNKKYICIKCGAEQNRLSTND